MTNEVKHEGLTVKKYVNNVLTGLAIGIVAGLIPSALLSEICKALAPHAPIFGIILQIVTTIMFTVPLLIGTAIAFNFKLNPIQMVAVASATYIGSGALNFTPNGVLVTGMGDLINTLLTASIAVGVVLIVGDKLKAFAPLVLPTIVCIVSGGLGLWMLPFVRKITMAVGQLVDSYFALQPIVMGIMVAVSFSIIILSPISTVAIATAISMSGIASGAGNLGVVAAAVGMFIGGLRVNPIGLSLSALLGTPKIMIAAVVRKPKILIPVVLNAALLGILAVVFDIKGTPISAGFGFSGLVGPINAIRFMSGGATLSNLLIIVLVFIIIPFAGGWFFEWLCRKLHLITKEDYSTSQNK
ncbi:PTS transporter subunit IIC [Sporolactobacillus kofuensis]|uniref:PTS transporter subunit IIC n=1 Tax=Sporolactobacillus kofuensis TaxID=269672 RepID=A0ABW1WEM1_9BACL|nr:PTS sugar transporter subunit IIC [Sporolactobacillus kofuensis]MCO7175007.1 PTS sugar transporter subunit IIC [Sporolactobacillus kofuensis]